MNLWNESFEDILEDSPNKEAISNYKDGCNLKFYKLLRDIRDEVENGPKDFVLRISILSPGSCFEILR